jgi:hypothetical protein
MNNLTFIAVIVITILLFVILSSARNIYEFNELSRSINELRTTIQQQIKEGERL